MKKKVLIIAGFDPTGNAGIIKDNTVCSSVGIDALTLITALTVQNNKDYFKTHPVKLTILKQQWRSLASNEITAIKVGMLVDDIHVKFAVHCIKEMRKNNPRIAVVWDPVLESSSGGCLLTDAGLKLALVQLMPLVSIITPNAIEVCKLTGIRYHKKICSQNVARLFFEKHRVKIYLKGGHLEKKSQDVFFNGKKIQVLTGMLSNKRIRGTGCAFSSVLACYLAQGFTAEQACTKSKAYMNRIFSQK